MNFHIQDHDREIRTSYWRAFNFEVLKIYPILLWKPLNLVYVHNILQNVLVKMN